MKYGVFLPFHLTDHHIEKLTRAESVPLAVLIRRREARLTFQCDEEKGLLMQSSYLPAKFFIHLAKSLACKKSDGL